MNEYTLAKQYLSWFLIITALLTSIMLLGLLGGCYDYARAQDIDEKSAVKAILGEASNQGYYGMLAVAVGIRNRGTLQGVYGLKAKHIYKEPKWIWDLAKKAWKESEYNRIHSGTHWENINAFGKPYWVKKMKLVYHYKDHNFYKKYTKLAKED